MRHCKCGARMYADNADELQRIATEGFGSAMRATAKDLLVMCAPCAMNNILEHYKEEQAS